MIVTLLVNFISGLDSRLFRGQFYILLRLKITNGHEILIRKMPL